jgi:hypothetical protein
VAQTEGPEFKPQYYQKKKRSILWKRQQKQPREESDPQTLKLLELLSKENKIIVSLICPYFMLGSSEGPPLGCRLLTY